MTVLETLQYHYTAISRKVVGKMCPTRKGNNTVPDFVALEPYFCRFPLVLANTRLWPAVWALMPFFQISFRDCLVHSFRQPFSTYGCIWTR